MYKRSFEGWVKHWDFILIDTICLQICFIIAHYYRFGYFFNWNRRNAYRTSSLVLILLSVVVAALFNTMHNVLRRSLWNEIKSSIIQCAIVFGGIVLLLFSNKASNRVSRIVLYVTMAGYFCLGIVTRLFYKRILIAKKKVSIKRVMLLVGDEKGIEKAQAAFKRHPEDGVSVKAVVRVDDHVSHRDEEYIPIESAAEYIRNQWIDEVYVTVTDLNLLPRDLIKACSEMAVTVHQAIYQSDEDENGNLLLEKIAKQPVLTTSINIPKPEQLFIKRCVDIVVGLLLSILALVILILATPFIKLLSPGPVLLQFERIGLNGKKFNIYMIRTMYMDASNRERKRIKGIGEFLHRWSLDRLPMGFNVLAGTMSLVGTRAPSVAEWESYEYHHRARLACKPGITGLSVVFGGRKELSFEEATRIDTEYITNWSPGLDLRILFTPAILRKQYLERVSET